MQAVDARLVTPEAVVLQFDTAGLGSRLLARLLDALLQGAALLAFTIVFAAAFSGSGGTALAIAYLVAVFVSSRPEVISSTAGLAASRWSRARILWLWIGIAIVSGRSRQVRS